MSKPQSMMDSQITQSETVTNGPGAAAILAAGIGSAALGILALANDAFPAVNKALIFYGPSGGLSGVSTMAVIIWLIAWFVLARRWGCKERLCSSHLPFFLDMVHGGRHSLPRGRTSSDRSSGYH